MSEKTGISQSCISDYERGIKSPTASNCVSLARVYGCTTDFLLAVKDKGMVKNHGRVDLSDKFLN